MDRLRKLFKNKTFIRFVKLAVVAILLGLMIPLYFYYKDPSFTLLKRITQKSNDLESVFYTDPELDPFKVNINNATEEDFMLLSDKISATIANRIISYRNDLGGSFYSIEDLLDVKGISDTIFDEIKDYITV